MTNNSIFKRVLALVLCLVMFAGVLTSCFQMPKFNPTVGTITPNTPTGGTLEKDPDTDPVDPIDPTPVDPEPVDPNELFSGSATLDNNALIYGALANDVFIGGGEDGVAAMIPADVKVEAGASSLSLSIKKVEEETLENTLSNLDVHVSGIALDNTTPMTVMLGAILPIGLANTELKLYHIENGNPVLMTRVNSAADFAIHNQYVYDAETGNVTIYVASFSVFTAVKTEVSKWEEGTEADTSWYVEGTDEYTLADVADFLGFRDLVDAGNTFEGKTVILGVDIDLDNKPFDPIGFGYWYEKNVVEGKDQNTVFMGTFDGGNHTIYNLYENCWELDPDKTTYGTYTYSTAGAGLFASIKNSTIKNLAISGAEIVFECVDMGVVVGYAQGTCHFENIIVTNAKIANYNRYTGGVVGEVSYGPYGIDTSLGYSHTFKNITVDSSVTVSGLWGSFGCGMGGVIGGKWGDATVLMENVVSAPVMDVYNDVVSAYQWYAFRGCGMLIGHTEEPYSDGRHSGIATAGFLTCENVKVYYGEWVNYTYYEFENQDNATGQRYPWVRAEAGKYCDAFSNIRYGVPTHSGVKVSDLTEEELKAVATDYTPIIFNQLYGADRGMYGQEAHDGVTVIKTNTKTIYIYNNSGWENLKLHYWYKHGDDTWTNHDTDGIDMGTMYLSTYNVYKISLPTYADGFRIAADNENSVEFTLADLEDGETYTVSGETHEHDFGDSNKCDCGAYKIQKGELVTDVSDLNAGDKIIIVAVNSDVALGTTQNSNNRNQVAIVKNGDGTVTINANVQIITLEAGNVEGTFAFNVGDGYLYAASSSSNHLKTQNDITNNGSWSITIENGVATIKAQGEYSRNWLMHNATSSIFSCYSSGQQDVAIYKLSTNEEIVEVHDCKEFAFGATCEDNAICSQCSNVIADSALGHDYVAKETAPICTDAGYITYTCSKCDDSYRAEGKEALGHNYVDNVCSVCGAIDSTAIDYSGRYYIATIRTTGNYFYMTNNLGTASTKRYQAVDTGFTTLPEEITNGENDKIFVLEKNDDGTYSIYAEGVNGNNYLGWTDDNSGILVAKADALQLTVDKKEDGTYNIHFNGDVERYLALNQNSGSNYFAWYKSGQKQNLILVPVKPCDHNYESNVTAPTCTADGYTTYTCTECGNSYTDNTVTATGHVNTTTTTVDATCTEAGSVTVKCDDCGETVNTETIPTIPHTDATDDNDHNCDVCGTENVTEHVYTDGVCDCGAEEPATPLEEEVETKYTFSDYAAGTQYAKDEEHMLDGNVTIITNDCHFTTQLRIYSSSTYDGYAIIKSANPITALGVNAGNKVDKLNVYGSNDDGNTWTLVGTIEVTSTSYKDYTLDLGAKYNWIKLDVAGSNQVRLASMTLTTLTSGSEGGETPACTHTNTTTTTVDATCTEAGSTTVTCDDCGATVSTTELPIIDHNYVDGTCSVCGAEDPNVGGSTEPTVVATFEFGENGSASHNDGSSKTSYSETNNGYTLNLTGGTNMYTGARDATGNSAIKLGSSSKTGGFSFTVPDDVTSVVIYIAKYKTNTTKITVNGTDYTLTNSSNDGAYDVITVDTTTEKTVTLTTVSGGVRAMVNTIKFYK